MKRFLRMQSELGSYMDKISEIDVSEIDNLKVVQQFDNRALTLMLGNQSYRERYENFLNNHEEIRKRLPDAITLDLRLKDRITAVSTAPAARASGSQTMSGPRQICSWAGRRQRAYALSCMRCLKTPECVTWAIPMCLRSAGRKGRISDQVAATESIRAAVHGSRAARSGVGRRRCGRCRRHVDRGDEQPRAVRIRPAA